MKDLLQGKLSEIEFAFGVLLAIGGGFTKSFNIGGNFIDAVKNGFIGFFVSIITGLIFVEYFNSPSIIVATMGMSGYSGASFLESINILGKTLEAVKTVLGEGTNKTKKDLK